MLRFPLTLRALALVPLLAALVEQARATLLCGAGARSCLQVAGDGRLGDAGAPALLLLGLALALLVARAASGGFTSRWAAGTLGVWALCGGWALLTAGAVTGGGWLGLVALGILAGAVLAVALRAAPVVARSLAPPAPRPPAAALPWWRPAAPLAGAVDAARGGLLRGRAPPALA